MSTFKRFKVCEWGMGWDTNKLEDVGSINSLNTLFLNDLVMVMSPPCPDTGRFFITSLRTGRMFWAHHAWFDDVVLPG